MYRIGQGFDAHRFKKGRRLIICQVEIPYEYGLEGHSDADVALHALCDAILGAIGDRDIGYYFPPTDLSIKGISSKKILDFVLDKMQKKNYEIVNVDLTLIAERPKFSPYIEDLKNNLSKLLNLPKENVGIKATTAEKMIFTDGIACLAIVLLRKKENKTG